MINKLKNNRGATMILALALFLICVMVSSIILVVAASGSGRVSQRVEEQQAYLAVSSTADAVATELDRCNKYVLENGSIVPEETDLEGTFGTYLKKAVLFISAHNAAYEDTINITSPDSRLPETVCSFKMEIDYGIEIIVKTVDSNYSIVIRSKAIKNTNEHDNAGVVTTTTTITWGSPDVTKGVGN